MDMDLLAAIEAHDLKRLAAMLQNGADPNQFSARTGCFALHAAIYELDFGGPGAAVDVLIRAGADVNRMELGTLGATPLIASLLEDKAELARSLLAAGANPNLPNNVGDSPLRISAEKNDLAMLTDLLKFGATATIDSAGGVAGKTALGHAVSNLNPAMVAVLLESGAKPSALDVDYQIADRYLPPPTHSNSAARDQIESMLKEFRHRSRAG